MEFIKNTFLNTLMILGIFCVVIIILAIIVFASVVTVGILGLSKPFITAFMLIYSSIVLGLYYAIIDANYES